MSSEVTNYKLEPWLDLSEALCDSVLQSLSIGYEGDLFALVVDPPFEYRNDGAGYPRISPIGDSLSLNYSIIRIDDQQIERITIDGQGPSYRFVQPLPGDELLVVASRAYAPGAYFHDMLVEAPRAHGNDEIKNELLMLQASRKLEAFSSQDSQDATNGHTFSRNGAFLHGIALSDAIRDVQTTAAGDIWVAYFDEAIGNYAQGIAKWGSNGKKRYQCWDRDVYDCYALNVTGRGEAWFYYYDDFELVHLKDDREINFWKVPVPGSKAFAIWRHLVLFDGGYYHHNEQFVLLEMKEDHQMTERARYAFVDSADQPIRPQIVAMREELVVVLQGTMLYRLFVYELSG
jgi:hypothetical protein